MHFLIQESTTRTALKPYQQGFTLIELMVSLVLGLLISAAAFQLLASSANGQRVQAAVSDIQDAAVFSMSYMKKEIAMANLGAISPMTQRSAWTGVVLTGNIGDGEPITKIRTGNLRGIDKGSDDDGNNLLALLTLSGNDTANSDIAGPNNVTEKLKSDQLTIQYQAPFDGTDCEGNSVNQGDMVIERFFTRVDLQTISGGTSLDNLNIVLACDAGTYQLPNGVDPDNITTDDIIIDGFGGNGEVLVNRVDDFEVQLGVQRENGIDYVSIDSYLDNTVTNGVTTYTITAPIVAIRFGIIVRGDSPVSGVTKDSYKVNGSTRTIETKDPSYVRRVYQGVVNLRNNEGEE